MGNRSDAIDTGPPRGSEPLRNELLCASNRLQRLVTKSETGRDRRRERAAGTSHVRAVDPRRLNATNHPIGRDGDVGREITGHGPAGHDHEACPEGCQPIGCILHIFRRSHIGSGQHSNLSEIRRNHGRKRKEAFTQRMLNIRTHQAITSAVDQHWVDNRCWQLPRRNAVGDQGHGLRRAKQTDFDRCERQTRNDAVELRLKEIERSRLHPVD